MDGSTEDDPYPTESDVDALLAEFGDDHRAAIRALLHDLDALARDYETSVSKGFIPGRRSNALARNSR